jgi:hypothetical protein
LAVLRARIIGRADKLIDLEERIGKKAVYNLKNMPIWLATHCHESLSDVHIHYISAYLLYTYLLFREMRDSTFYHDDVTYSATSN